MTGLVIVEGVVIVLLVILVAGLLRSHADILRRLHALDGDADPARTDGLQIASRGSGSGPATVSGLSPGGDSTAVALKDSRGMVLLAFLSSGCTTCRPFWEAFGSGAAMPGPDVRPVIVTKSPSEESPARIGELAPPAVTTIMSSEAWDQFRIPVSPYFVMVDAGSGSVVGEGAAGSWDHVRQLLEQAMADAGVGNDRMSTRRRSERTGERLSSAGIEPGDPSLYRNPHEKDGS